MRIVITGATGNVGTALVRRLSASGEHTLVGLARRLPDTGDPDAAPEDVTYASVDLTKDDAVAILAREFRGADAVVHLAWLFQPTHRPAVTWAANVEGTARLLSAVADAGVQTLVQASSVGAYSPHPARTMVDESWPTHGVATAAYSREKAYAERLLDGFELAHPDVRVVRLRPAFTFREEAAVQQRRLFAGPFVPAKLFRKVRVPVLPDPGGLAFQTVHTDDVAAAYQLALHREVTGAFNIATDPVLDMAMIGEILGVPVKRMPVRAARSALSAAWAAHLVPAEPGLFDLLRLAPLMSTRRAREELGWAPEHDAVDAFQTLLAGIESGEGAPTPPLSPDTSGPLRRHEIATGVGEEP